MESGRVSLSGGQRAEGVDPKSFFEEPTERKSGNLTTGQLVQALQTVKPVKIYYSDKGAQLQGITQLNENLSNRAERKLENDHRSSLFYSLAALTSAIFLVALYRASSNFNMCKDYNEVDAKMNCYVSETIALISQTAPFVISSIVCALLGKYFGENAESIKNVAKCSQYGMLSNGLTMSVIEGKNRPKQRRTEMSEMS